MQPGGDLGGSIRLAVLWLALSLLVCCCHASSAADPNSPTVFAALSDWGGTGVDPFTKPAQLAVASALANVSEANDVQFVLSAGNNFLPAGLPLGSAESEQTQERWFSTWTTVYKEPSVPWYLVAGYADWMGNCTAERAFTDVDSTGRWQFPALWHTVNVAVPPNWGTMQIVMLDTVTLSGQMVANAGPHTIPLGVDGAASAAAAAPTAAASPPAGQAPPHGGEGAVIPGVGKVYYGPSMLQASSGRHRRRLADFNLKANPPISTVQWAWLESYLNASTAQWLVVVGNDPIWSAGAHGPTWALADKLLPILDAAGVALYISGRDPVAQHFTASKQYPAVDFACIGTGAGGNATQAATLPSLALNPSGTLDWFYGASGAFLTVSMGVDPKDATTSTMTVSFYDQAGVNLHSFTKGNPRTKGSADPPVGKVSSGTSDSAVGQGVVVLVALVIGVCGGVGYFHHLSNQPEGGDKSGAAAKRAAAPAPAAQVQQPEVPQGPALVRPQSVIGRVRGMMGGAATERTALLGKGKQPQKWAGGNNL